MGGLGQTNENRIRGESYVWGVLSGAYNHITLFLFNHPGYPLGESSLSATLRTTLKL